MRMTRLFVRTLREDPAGAALPGLALLCRAGYVLPSGRTLLYLPLGARVRRRLLEALERALDAQGGQEIAFSAPPLAEGVDADAWRESRTSRGGDAPVDAWTGGGGDAAADRRTRCRADAAADRWTRRSGDPLAEGRTSRCGGPVCDLARHVIASYRQLPCLLHARIEVPAQRSAGDGGSRAAGGTLLAAYSLHANEAEGDAGRREVAQGLARAIRQWGIECHVVAGDPLRLGGCGEELISPLASGDRRLSWCRACDEWSLAELAEFTKPVVPGEPPAPLELVPTPGASTIQAVADLLGVGAPQTAKAIFLVAEVGTEREARGANERLVFAVLRGDMSLSEAKLAAAIGATRLRPATGEEIRAIGAEPGFGSPVGISRQGVCVVVDDMIPLSTNLVAGANRIDYHFRNVNYARDYHADLVADLALAEEGTCCRRCGQPLAFVSGVALGCAKAWPVEGASLAWPKATSATGVAQALAIASYEVEVDRLLAALAETHHDDAGLVWPPELAPFAVHLVAVGGDADSEVAGQADALYRALLAAGVEVLYDDRPERPGVKFYDADRIGIPWRVTLGKRSLAHGVVEARRRVDGSLLDLPLDDAAAAVRRLTQDQDPVQS